MGFFRVLFVSTAVAGILFPRGALGTVFCGAFDKAFCGALDKVFCGALDKTFSGAFCGALWTVSAVLWLGFVLWTGLGRLADLTVSDSL